MKKIALILCMTIVYLLFSSKNIFSATEEKDVPPILDNKVLLGFYLYKSDRETCSWEELRRPVLDYHKKRGISEKKAKSEKIVYYTESWGSITKEQIEIEKNRAERSDYTILGIYRTCLMSRESTQEWLKMELIDHPWEKGSFSGKLIGDACWSNKSKLKNDKKKFSATILFIKKNQLVRITVTRMHGSVDPDFAEKIALTVASRI